MVITKRQSTVAARNDELMATNGVRLKTENEKEFNILQISQYLKNKKLRSNKTHNFQLLSIIRMSGFATSDVSIHNSEIILGLIQCTFSDPIELSLFLQEKNGSLVEISKVPVQNKIPFLVPILKNDNNNDDNNFDHNILTIKLHTPEIVLYHHTVQLGFTYLHNLGEIAITPAPILQLAPPNSAMKVAVEAWLSSAAGSFREIGRSVSDLLMSAQAPNNQMVPVRPSYYSQGKIKFGTNPSLELSLVVYILLFFSLITVLVSLCGGPGSRRVSRKHLLHHHGNKRKQSATSQDQTDIASHRLPLLPSPAAVGLALEGNLSQAGDRPAAAVVDPEMLSSIIPTTVKRPVIHTVSLADRQISSTVARRRTVTIVEEQDEGDVLRGQGREGDDPDDDFLAVLLTNETFLIEK